MKKQLFTLSFALCAAFGYSQNSNPWPITGSVGIGTATPTVLLDVIGGATHSGAAKYAYFGTRTSSTGVNGNGIYLGSKSYYITGIPPLLDTTLGRSSIITVMGTTNTAYIDFNSPSATSSTTESAVRFGYGTSEIMRLNLDGKVRIGNTKMPVGYKLFVEEGILTEKVKVALKTTADWADYVFATDYKLMPLEEVEKFTKENNHLPNVPSAAEMVNNGLDVAKMDAKLLEKIEELTLYAVAQNDEAKKLKEELEQQKKEVAELKAMMNVLLEKK